MSVPQMIAACGYAYGYSPTPICWPNARNPLQWDEERFLSSLSYTDYILHRLARAKILQSLLDLGGNDSIRNQAASWIFSDTGDFRAFCDDAGFHPKSVRLKAKDIIENGLNWRAAPGDSPRYEQKRAYKQRMKETV